MVANNRAGVNARHAALSFLLVFAASSSKASDITIPTPTGWRPSPNWFAAAGSNVAVGLMPLTSASVSKVFQWRNGLVVSTDLPGSVYFAQYDPSGDRLVVKYTTTGLGGAEGAPNVAVINATGTILWSAFEAQPLQLSGTGEVLYSLDGSGDRIVRAYATATGAFIRSFRAVQDVKPHAAVEVDNGNSVVFAQGSSLLQFTAGHANEDWRRDLAGSDYGVNALRAFGPDRFVVEQDYGWFKVMDTGNHVLYNHDCVALDLSDSFRTWRDYAQYRPHPTSDPGRILLFDGTANGFVVNLATGVLTAFTINTSVPSGHVAVSCIVGQRLAFVGVSDVVIRPIALP